MDSVRAQNTSIHDYVRDTTPFLAEFADTATVYEHSVAPGHWSLPSHASIFTGEHVDEHMLVSRKYCLEAGHTVWEQLSGEYDYDTGVFSSNTFVVDSDFGLNRGFDTVVNVPQNRLFNQGVSPADFEDIGYLSYLYACLNSSHTSESILNGLHTKLPSAPLLRRLYPDNSVGFAEEFLAWEKQVSEPWAACLNLMEAHGPYADSEQYDEWANEYLRTIQDEKVNDYAIQCGEGHWFERRALENLYDCAIATIDQRLKLIIENLRRQDVLDETLVIITSDHGEAFGEQSNVRPTNQLQAHSFGLHESLLHVPLIVKAPGQTERRRVSETVSLTAFPNVVDAALSGANSYQPFVTDTQVIASGYNHRIEEYSDMIREHCGSTDRFTGEIRATYAEEKGEKRKFIQWGDDEATVRMHETGVTEKISQSASGRIESAFENIQNREIRNKRGETNEYAKRRLKELGYIQ
jgi:arylsulfatase A-like enzyme